MVFDPETTEDPCGNRTNINNEVDKPVINKGFNFFVDSNWSLNTVRGSINKPIVKIFYSNASKGVMGINSPKQPQLLASPLNTWTSKWIEKTDNKAMVAGITIFFK